MPGHKNMLLSSPHILKVPARPPLDPPNGMPGQGYHPPNEPASEYQTIPMNKIEDFGVHCKSYYPLDISFFKSSLDAHILDLLWHKYWVNTLSASPLITTRHLAAGQYADIGVPPQVWGWGS